MKKYSDVTCCETNGKFYAIEARNERESERKTIAFVHAASGDVAFCEPEAETDGKVKEAIDRILKEIGKGQEVPDDFCFAHLKVEGRFDVRVPKGTVEEMKEAAAQEWYGADFGELTEADMEIVYIQDADGNWLYEA